jgi:hypothetical protein
MFLFDNIQYRPDSIRSDKGPKMRATPIADARRFVAPIILVLLWQAGSMAGLISPRTLAAPSRRSRNDDARFR